MNKSKIKINKKIIKYLRLILINIMKKKINKNIKKIIKNKIISIQIVIINNRNLENANFA
jgi:hypothetical protein